MALAILGHSAELSHLLPSDAHRAHTYLSISLLWRFENAFLHKSLLPKSLFTEVLPLSLLLLPLLLNLRPLCLLFLLLGFQVFISRGCQFLLVLCRVLSMN